MLMSRFPSPRPSPHPMGRGRILFGFTTKPVAVVAFQSFIIGETVSGCSFSPSDGERVRVRGLLLK